MDFSSGAVDPEHFPYNTWRRLLKNAFNEYDEGLLRRTPPQGDWELRRAIAAYLYDAGACTARRTASSSAQAPSICCRF